MARQSKSAGTLNLNCFKKFSPVKQEVELWKILVIVNDFKFCSVGRCVNSINQNILFTKVQNENMITRAYSYVIIY